MPTTNRGGDGSSTVSELCSDDSRRHFCGHHIMNKSESSIASAGLPEDEVSCLPVEQSSGAIPKPYDEQWKSPSSSLGYPPMPASAQLVSAVQEQIIQSAVPSSFSPSISADVSSCSTPDTDTISPVVVSSAECCIDKLLQSELNSSAGSAAATASQSRLTTPRRSRVVARLNLLSTLNGVASANH